MSDAIATLLATLDVEVDWIDEREEAFPRQRHSAHAVADTRPQGLCRCSRSRGRRTPPGVLPRADARPRSRPAHRRSVLRRGDFGFLGLIGSKTKRQRFIHRFEQRGVEADAIARLTCPIGVEGSSGKQPELLALAVVGAGAGVFALTQRPAEPEATKDPAAKVDEKAQQHLTHLPIGL
jgi:xanthine dehydrogenase accessory factor